MSETRGAGGPPEPSQQFFYIYRNYDEDDEEYFVTALEQEATFEQIGAYGFTAPSGKKFKEYNAERDGSGTSYDVGDAIPAGAGAVYWIIWEDDVVIDYLTTNQELTSIANAIRTKGGTSASLTYPAGFVSAIENLPSGGGIYQAKTNITPTTSSQTITPDSGYDALSSVQINAMPSGTATTPATTITAQPTISVNSSTGVITASNSKTQNVTPTVSAGYVSSGTAGTITVSGSNTSNLTTQAAQTITPTTTDQTIASGKYLTGTQTIKGDANLVAGNIKKDVQIFGVTGTYEGGGGGNGKDNEIISRTISGTYENQSTTVIGFYALYSCSKLQSVNFPNCTKISSFAFANCGSLTTISFPKCTAVDTGAFSYCSRLKTAIFPSCTTIGNAGFSGCSQLNTADFPLCTTIGTAVFSYCASLSSISFPKCTLIGSSAFTNCTSLTVADFPLCSVIWSSAFYSCRSISIASLPSCTTIHAGAFYRCYNLLSLYLLGSSVVSLKNTTAFSSTPIGGYTGSTGGVYGSIYVPSSLLASYKAATNWTYFSSRFVGV